MLQVSYTYIAHKKKKKIHSIIFWFTGICFYFGHHHDLMLCLGCFMISQILMTDFTCFILMISMHLFLMFIYFVYFHMCVCVCMQRQHHLEVCLRLQGGTHTCAWTIYFSIIMTKKLWLEPEKQT